MKKNRIFLLLGMGLLLFTACNSNEPEIPLTPDPPVEEQPAVSNDDVVAAIEIQEVMLELRENGIGIPTGIAEATGRINADNSSSMRRAAARGISPQRFLALQDGNEKYTVFRFENDSVPPGDDSDTTVVDPPHDGDTTVTDPGCDYDTACVHEEYYMNDDGSYTYVVDYGDGCEIYGEFYKGKFVETYRYEGGSFFSKVEYFAFGGEDWEINGSSIYEGIYEYGEDSVDTVYEYYSTYSWQDDLSYEWADDGEEYKADVFGYGNATITHEEYRVTSQVYEIDYREGEDEAFYRYEVIEALVYDFTCDEYEDIYIWVSGIEKVEATEGSFTIDYGDGSCDNSFTVTIEGVDTIVDLDEDWEEDWEEEDAG